MSKNLTEIVQTEFSENNGGDKEPQKSYFASGIRNGCKYTVYPVLELIRHNYGVSRSDFANVDYNGVTYELEGWQYIVGTISDESKETIMTKKDKIRYALGTIVGGAISVGVMGLWGLSMGLGVIKAYLLNSIASHTLYAGIRGYENIKRLRAEKNFLMLQEAKLDDSK